MSSLELRIKAHHTSTHPTLADRLRALHIVVPDQDRVRHMMDAIRVGAPIGSSWLRRRLYGLRLPRPGRWEVFEYRHFLHNRGFEYGGGVPPSVQQEAARIREHLPDAKLRVHATYADPVLEVILGSERVFTRGWMHGKVLF